MNYKISFWERASISMMYLSSQLHITLEAAREQTQWLRENSSKTNLTNRQIMVNLRTIKIPFDKSKRDFNVML